MLEELSYLARRWTSKLSPELRLTKSSGLVIVNIDPPVISNNRYPKSDIWIFRSELLGKLHVCTNLQIEHWCQRQWGGWGWWWWWWWGCRTSARWSREWSPIWSKVKCWELRQFSILSSFGMFARDLNTAYYHCWEKDDEVLWQLFEQWCWFSLSCWYHKMTADSQEL